MNNCDSENHRTGHPRWAQLMANTVYFPGSEQRTYAGTFAVSPSHGFENGLRNVTRVVSPAGKSAVLPIVTQSRYSLRRKTGPSRYATTGVAMASPTTAFNAMPTFIRNVRRVTLSCSRRCACSLGLGGGSFSSIGSPALLYIRQGFVDSFAFAACGTSPGICDSGFAVG